MKVKNLDFLVNSKPLVRKLITMLSTSYPYVSVLGTDTKGKSYRVSKMGTEVNDFGFTKFLVIIKILMDLSYVKLE